MFWLVLIANWIYLCFVLGCSADSEDDDHHSGRVQPDYDSHARSVDWDRTGPECVGEIPRGHQTHLDAGHSPRQLKHCLQPNHILLHEQQASHYSVREAGWGGGGGGGGEFMFEQQAGTYCGGGGRWKASHHY